MVDILRSGFLFERRVLKLPHLTGFLMHASQIFPLTGLFQGTSVSPIARQRFVIGALVSL